MSTTPSSQFDSNSSESTAPTALTTSASAIPPSDQSRPPSSVSQTSMAATTTAATSAPTSQSPSAAPSTVPSTTQPSTSSSSPLSTTQSSTDSDTPRSTSTSVQPTTSTSKTVAPTTTQPSSSSSSPSPTSSQSAPPSTSTAASSTPISTASPSPSTVSSSPPHSDSSSPASPSRSDTLLTTVLEGTTIFVTSTNSQGQVVTSVPPVVTEVLTTTGSGGLATTITQAVINPTLASNDNATDGSSFFTNTGAVVGVFVVVGLACASIFMWILFAIRRRFRMRSVEEDNAVEAAVAAAGLNRAPLDDDDDDGPISPNAHNQFLPEMGQRTSLLGGSGSLPTSARLSDLIDDPARDSDNSRPISLVENRSSTHPKGYMPARTSSPSPRLEQGVEDLGSSRDRKSSYGYTPTYSAGSFEPLLANYLQNASDQDNSGPSTEPPRRRSSRRLSTSLVRDSDGNPLNGSKTSLKKQNSSDSLAFLNEDEDNRYALTVRNVPDNQSQHSSE